MIRVWKLGVHMLGVWRKEKGQGVEGTGKMKSLSQSL